ncbi:protein kinase family protein [Paenisporosarcina sp. TG20]|uniref:serine/threonine protein kinase n=1 Tax=Paenisporosarcina sp. TG20 TaxID=1211706 RepID=UPI0002FC3BAD|nr:protein kinase family protein [Paenisporosarcina sp. TG20]
MSLVFKVMKRGYRFFTDRYYKRNTIIHDRYKVNSLLGIGSYGMTYLCQEIDTKKVCVLKQMTKSKNKKLILAQYKQETTILEQLNHPNIPNLFESFSFQNNHFFSMEYIKGRNLEEVLFLKEQVFTERESLILIRDLLQVVDYIHSMGFIHGDIRIPNIIINDQKPYIIDFGLAKRYMNETSNGDSNKNNVGLLREDFYDIGDLLLFLLYSNYHTDIKKGRSWTEELTLHPKTSHLLKRLLRMEQPYFTTKDIITDVNQTIDHLTNVIY